MSEAVFRIRTLIFLLVLAGFVWMLMFNVVSTKDFSIGGDTLKFEEEVRFDNGAVLRLALADDEIERELGLSHTSRPARNNGMLFVFDLDGRHGIWMKDMNYELDVIWVNRLGKVVHIEEFLRPESYPTIFRPRENSRYVIEVPTGFVDRADIQVGQFVTSDVMGIN